MYKKLLKIVSAFFLCSLFVFSVGAKVVLEDGETTGSDLNDAPALDAEDMISDAQGHGKCAYCEQQSADVERDENTNPQNHLPTEDEKKKKDSEGIR